MGDDWVDWLIYVHAWVLRAGVTIRIGWDKSRGTDPTKSDWKKVVNTDMQQAKQPKIFFLVYKTHHIITLSLQSWHFEISRFKSYITFLVVTCPCLIVPSFAQLSVQRFINRTWNMWGWRIKGGYLLRHAPRASGSDSGGLDHMLSTGFMSPWNLCVHILAFLSYMQQHALVESHYYPSL